MRNKHRLVLVLSTAVLICGCSDDDSPVESPPPVGETVIIRVPGDQPTLQAAVDAASESNTILVAPGAYTGEGNRDIMLARKNLTITSEAGPRRTIINLSGSSSNMHRAFTIESGIDHRTVIDGFTFLNGHHTQAAAIFFRSSSPTIRNCVFADNTATVSGGVLRCKTADPWFERCTFVGNRAPSGGVTFLFAGSEPRFISCLFSFSGEGGAVVCDGSSDRPMFTCSNLYGNVGGDWTACIDSLTTLNGNLSVDPLFVDPEEGDFRLRPGSPCLPAGNFCGSQIGALGAAD